MASGLTRNQVPGNRLRVRPPCPPLLSDNALRRLVRAEIGVPALQSCLDGQRGRARALTWLRTTLASFAPLLKR